MQHLASPENPTPKTHDGDPVAEHRARVMSIPCRIRPLRDVVVVAPVEALDASIGSIVIPDAYRSLVANRSELVRVSDQWAIGIVRSVGRGLQIDAERRISPDVEPGAVVWYRRAEASDAPELEPWPLIFVHERSIAGKVSP